MKNRYMFYKKLYPYYVIVFIKNNKYRTMGIDKLLIKYLKNKDINYIIIDYKNNIVNKTYQNNKYKKYIIKEFLYYLVNEKYKNTQKKC